MCLPVAVMAGISLATAAAGAGVSAMAASQQGHAQAQAATYEASVADLNRQTALRNAAITAAASEREQDQQMQKTRAVVGAQRAAAAASGFDVNFGTDATLQDQSLKQGRADALTIRQNYQQQVEDTYAQAGSFGIQGAASRSRAASATAAGNMGALSSILGGASSVSSQWAGFQNKGIFGAPKGAASLKGLF